MTASRSLCCSSSKRLLCSAVPYEEDDRDSSIWFLDHSYLESMFQMFKKVNGEVTTCKSAVKVDQTVPSSGTKLNQIGGWHSAGASGRLVQHWSQVERS